MARPKYKELFLAACERSDLFEQMYNANKDMTEEFNRALAEYTRSERSNRILKAQAERRDQEITLLQTRIDELLSEAEGSPSLWQRVVDRVECWRLSWTL